MTLVSFLFKNFDELWFLQTVDLTEIWSFYGVIVSLVTDELI
jgi:hypothetical protein